MIEIKKIITSKINIFNILFIVFIFLIDRFSKIKVINQILNSNSSIYINDYLNFDLTWNRGIGFGLFTQRRSVGSRIGRWCHSGVRSRYRKRANADYESFGLGDGDCLEC